MVVVNGNHVFQLPFSSRQSWQQGGVFTGSEQELDPSYISFAECVLGIAARGEVWNTA